MAKNVILMIGDGMGWEMARAAAVANGSPFYTSGQGTGLSFQTLTGYTYATTYGTTIAPANGTFNTSNGALNNTISNTGDSPLLPGFLFDPTFNAGVSLSGGTANTNPYAVGNLVGYDPVRGGVNPWTAGTDPAYIKLSYPDSANTATTLYTGVKTYNNAIGVDIFENTIESILVTANKQGKSTGLVTSVPIDHATPGAAAASVNRRSKYDADFPGLDNILQQELRTYQPTVLLGGGHPLSTPEDLLPAGVEPNRSNVYIAKSTYDYLVANPTDNRYGYDFLERGPNAAAVLAATAATIDPNAGDRLLGLYGARGQDGNLPVSSANGDYSTTGLGMFTVNSSKGLAQDTTRPLLPGETNASFIARERNENPTLKDLTDAALNVLGRDKDGFWLMVEGGDIDWAAHDNNIDNLIGTVNDFDKAVKSTIDWIGKNGGWDQNLLIVTADHDHYLTLTPDYPTLLAAKGAEALTAIDDYTQVGNYWGSNPAVDGKYGWGNHSNRPVPVYYQGAGSSVLTNSIGTGYSSYGYDIPGVANAVDQVDIYQAMYQAVTGKVAVIPGTSSGNYIQGTNGDDTIEAGAGDDLVFANEGSNTVHGGAGNDVLYGGSGLDRLYAGDGDNRVYAGEGNNVILAGAGNDVVYMGSGDDLVSVGNGNNAVYAGEGKNEIAADSGNDLIYSGAGLDIIYGGDGDNVIFAGEGNNNVTTGTGNDRITTGAGNDVIAAGNGSNVVTAGEGNNSITTGSGADLIYAGAGNDTISTGAGNDLIYAGEGVNLIYAGDGDNLIFAGEGNNNVFTGAGSDRIYSGAGNDTINAGDGGNVIFAGEGNNSITTGSAADLIYAGAGNDTISTGAGNDLIYAGEGVNVINSGVGDDLIFSGSGADTFTLNKGDGMAMIMSFQSIDKFALGAGLLRTELSVLAIGSDTLISAGTDYLAMIKGTAIGSVAGLTIV
jgi:alkaline phosphatase